MVLGALGCVNNEDFENIVNDNIVLDVFIICQKLHFLKSLKKCEELRFVKDHGTKYTIVEIVLHQIGMSSNRRPALK